MYPAYTATKQAVNTDDTSGIRTIYNSRQNDFFDANGANDSTRSADDISSYIDGNGQLTLSALDSTTPVMIGTNDIDWYKITVPASTTGTMVVRMQSTKLSLLAPSLAVYNAAGTTMLGQQISYNTGDTVTVTINNVSAGQVYDIRGQGFDDRRFGFRGLRPPGEFRLAHPAPGHGPEHHHGRGGRPGRRHAERVDRRRRDRRRSSRRTAPRSPASRRSGSTTTTNRRSARTTGSSVPRATATIRRTRPIRRLDHMPPPTAAPRRMARSSPWAMSRALATP